MRHSQSCLADGAYERVPAPQGLWVWRRGQCLVAVNFSDQEPTLDLAPGAVLLSTQPGRDITASGAGGSNASLRLAAWEGVVVRPDA